MTTGLELLNLGYTDLIEVTPPGCKLSPFSKIKDEDRGKCPGTYHPDGWSGYNWQRAPAATPADVERWATHNANVGLLAAHYPGVDIDCTNERLSSLIRTQAVAHLGMAPERVGRSPKRLLVYHCDTPFRRMRLWIMEPNGTKHLIEILGAGQQYVVAGIHPTTKKPYAWTQLYDAANLETITQADAEAWLDHMEELLDVFGYTCTREGAGAVETDRTQIDQAALSGDANRIRLALSFLPNTNELFPGRDDYLRVGYAIKAALGESGRELFEEWATTWEGNDRFAGNDPATVSSDWDRMHAPFEVGAPWLYEMAQKRGYDWAADEFTADLDAPSDDVSDAELAAAYAAQGAAAAASAAAANPRPDKYTDAAMSNRLVRRYGKSVRYCPEQSKWYAWDGDKWMAEGKGDVYRLMANLLHEATDEIYRDSNLTPSERSSKAYVMGSQGKRASCVAYAECEKPLIVKTMDFDADPYLLNTPGGVVDLKTGEITECVPEMLMTRTTAVMPSSGVPAEWLRFLNEATGTDPEMIDYLQRVAGYALSGDKSIHSLHFFYGPGGNGKGTFLNTLRDIWGDYAEPASMATFVSSRYDKHPTELADLAGARLVIAQETDEGRSWDEAKLKQLTSNDPVKARFMAKDFFEFVPTFKLLFSGNHRPSIKNVDAAMKRRIHIVPFVNAPKRVDPYLSEKLKSEAAQILQWCIDGAVKFFVDGFRDPERVHEATQEYFESEDDFTQWLQERTTAGTKNDFVETKALADDYNEWAESNGERRRSTKSIAGLLVDHGFQRGRRTALSGRGFFALKLTHEPGDEFGYDPALA
ncbi:MAG TPA: phage/plasmid primase, P4 family [Gemmatimonadaceae bacterium]|nr:phage/plasmid primase, P4 family [Gemmatimonadaceae bacterium]